MPLLPRLNANVNANSDCSLDPTQRPTSNIPIQSKHSVSPIRTLHDLDHVGRGPLSNIRLFADRNVAWFTGRGYSVMVGDGGRGELSFVYVPPRALFFEINFTTPPPLPSRPTPYPRLFSVNSISQHHRQHQRQQPTHCDSIHNLTFI